MPGLLVIMGSGETAPTMIKPHRSIFERVGDRPAVLVDTPYGFQSNADDISSRAVGYFAASVGREVEVVSWRTTPPPGLTTPPPGPTSPPPGPSNGPPGLSNRPPGLITGAPGLITGAPRLIRGTPPGRSGHGTLLTAEGRLNLRNARFASDPSPPDPACACSTCARWSRVRESYPGLLSLRRSV